MVGEKAHFLSVWRNINVKFLNKLILLALIAECKSAPKPNVLFLMVDDLRPDIGVYQDGKGKFPGPIDPGVYQDGKGKFPGPTDPPVKTPNLDSLAKESLVLRSAYCQQALCSPSRTSLLTGRRPDTTHIYDLETYFREETGDFTTIPQYFAQHGYNSVGMGKIFHPREASNYDDPPSWTEPFQNPQDAGYSVRYDHTWEAVSKPNQKKHPLEDQLLLDTALKTLTRLSKKAKSGVEPFFFAVGFKKPHLPFLCPTEFFDLYPTEDLQLPNNPYAPVDMPIIAWSWYGEMTNWYKDVIALNVNGHPNTTLPDEMTLNLRRAYFSCVSYIDDLIGQLLTRLKDLNLEDNTIVVFVSDHGWQLGEHGEWSKHTNFELSTQVPFMIKIPGLTDKGKQSKALVELVDIFPTLLDAAKLPQIPTCPEESSSIKTCHEGISLLPLIKDPLPTKWRSAAFSQYPRSEHSVMGYSIRTKNFRYTEWPAFSNKPHFAPHWSLSSGVELYDHRYDPDENWNRANDPKYKKILETLRRTLRAGWRAALPS